MWITQYSGSVLGNHNKTLSEVLRTGGFVHIVTSSFVFVSWEFFGEGSELGNNGHVGVPMALQKNCCTFLGVFGSARGGPIT